MANGSSSFPRFERNAFRILGLPASATETEVLDAASARRREAKLGMSRPTPYDFTCFGPVPRTESDIQDAATRLQDPQTRLIERLFWAIEDDENIGDSPPGFDAFQSKYADATKSASDALRIRMFDAFLSNYPETTHSTTLHDWGLVASVRFIVTGKASGIEHGEYAIRAWMQSVLSDDVWEALVDMDAAGGFERPIVEGDIVAVRGRCKEIALKPFIDRIRNLIRDNSDGEASQLLQITKAALDGDDAEEVESGTLTDLEQELISLCEEVRTECSSKITRFDDVVLPNRPPVIAAEKRYRNEIEPLLDRILRIQSKAFQGIGLDFASFSSDPGSGLVVRCRIAVAECLLSVAMDGTWAELPLDIIRIAGLAKKIAPATAAGQKLSADAEELVQRQAAFQRDQQANARRDFTPPQAVGVSADANVAQLPNTSNTQPWLFTLNGIGCKFYGATDHTAGGWYVTTHWFVVLFFPIFALSRYLVSNAPTGGYHIQGSLPLLRWQIIWNLGLALLITVLLVAVMSDSSSSSYSGSAPPNSSPYATTQPTIPVDTKGVGATAPSMPDYSSGTSQKTTSTEWIDGINRATISELSTGIDAMKIELSELEGQIDEKALEIDTWEMRIENMKQDIEDQRSSLDTTDQFALDEFNALVDDHNSGLATLRELIDRHDEMVEEYNNMLAETKVLIQRHNAIVDRLNSQ